MVGSTIPCLKELREDPKTSTGFKDRTREDWEIQKVIKNTSIGQFTALASRVLKVSANISSAFSLFDSRLFRSSKDCLQEYSKDNFSSLGKLLLQWNRQWNTCKQQMAFEGKTWIDRQGTQLESKVFWSRLYLQFRLSYVPRASDSTTNDPQEVTSHFLTDSTPIGGTMCK